MPAERILQLRVPGYHFFRSCTLVLLAAMVMLSCFYLLESYEGLAAWYLGLHHNISYQATWTKDFFTPETYRKGRLLSMVALVMCTGGFYYLFRTRKKLHVPLKCFLPVYDALIIALLSVLCCLLWVIGHKMLEIEIDEVYSAIYGSGIHPFQTITYYMDTNNHILFNIINNLVFHFAADKVFTGRLISLCAYLVLNAAIYLWLKDLLKIRWIAAIITIVVMCQLSTWGFAVRARGYEIYLLCQWVSFIAFYKYVINTNKNWLLLYTIANIAGFYTVPTLL